MPSAKNAMTAPAHTGKLEGMAFKILSKKFGSGVGVAATTCAKLSAPQQRANNMKMTKIKMCFIVSPYFKKSSSTLLSIDFFNCSASIRCSSANVEGSFFTSFRGAKTASLTSTKYAGGFKPPGGV
jgi:hypothetical protein